jgi:hypothetical protein
MMDMTDRETLIVLFKQLYTGLALFGAGMAGISLTFDEINNL